MKRLKRIMVLLITALMAFNAQAQDPSFSQFFSSPLNINPALTARINSKWRAIANIRDEWVGPASPYATGTISFDSKILKNKIPENTVLGLGGMMMYDQAMAGVLKSNYASLDASYNIKIAGDADDHRLGIGVGMIYGQKQIDFSRLNFEQQFTGYGFNTNLPTGETALANMRPYMSVSAGLIYTYSTEFSNLDIGVAGFHFNKPKQTVVNDPRQYLAARYVAHANFETFLTDRVVLNTNAIYQTQSAANYFSVGGAVGYFLSNEGEDDLAINGGMWYWSNNAIVPYLGLTYKNWQFGLTYDATISKLSQAAQKPRTFELSIIIRGDDRPKGVIPCPWK